MRLHLAQLPDNTYSRVFEVPWSRDAAPCMSQIRDKEAQIDLSATLIYVA